LKIQNKQGDTDKAFLNGDKQLERITNHTIIEMQEESEKDDEIMFSRQ